MTIVLSLNQRQHGNQRWSYLYHKLKRKVRPADGVTRVFLAIKILFSLGIPFQKAGQMHSVSNCWIQLWFCYLYMYVLYWGGLCCSVNQTNSRIYLIILSIIENSSYILIRTYQKTKKNEIKKLCLLRWNSHFLRRINSVHLAITPFVIAMHVLVC